jgi:hypothetical protein
MVSTHSMDWNDVVTAFNDLVSFVRGLKHGGHFADRLARYIAPPRQPAQVRVTVIEPGGSIARQRAEQRKEDEADIQELIEGYRL